MAKKAVKKNACTIHSGREIGLCLLILGTLIVLNSIYGWFTWPVFIGGLIGLKGLRLLINPNCCK